MNEQQPGNGDQGSAGADSHRRVPHVSILRRGRDSNTRKFLQGFLGPAIICLAALLAMTPDFMRGNSCGHDFDFHLASWFDARAAWSHGLFYPHWAPSPNYSAGEPRFVFYPPLTWMLGAFFGLIFPWKAVGLAITCSFLALTGLATRALARRMLPDAPSTLAGCVALYSGYSMFTAYERSAFGELTGGFWIPLLLLFVLRDQHPEERAWRRAFDGSVVLLALVIAGAWLSNDPLGVMACYLLAAVALVVAILRRSWAPILRSVVAVTLGLALSAIYLVPAALEQRWVQISAAINDPGVAIENSFLFGRHANPSLELHDAELFRISSIAVAMFAVASLCIFVAWRRGRLPRDKSWWIPLTLIPIAILLLQFPFSLPIWNVLPKLRFLQFPWRWLVVVEAPLGIFFAAALWPTRRWLRIAVITASALMFLATITVSVFLFHQFCDEEDAVHAMIATYRSGQGFEGSDEYAPPGADDSLVAVGLPDACLTTNPDTVVAKSDDGNVPEWDPANGHCDAVYQWRRRNAEHLRLVADIPHAGFLILHLRNYAAWQVRVNRRLIAFGADPVLLPLPRRDDGLMAVPVSKGPVQISIDWGATPDVVTGRWLSAIALILLIALYATERRLKSHTHPMRPSQPDKAAPRV